MIISPHFIAGAAVGKLTGNPILAVVIGFVFHFVMDMVPHWNYGYKSLKKIKTFLLILLDPFLAFILFLAIGLVRGFDFSTWLATFLGGFVCALPDLIEFIIRIFKLKPLAFYLRFHRAIHWFDKKPADIWETAENLNPSTAKRVFWGLIYQIPFVLVSVYLLVR